MNDTPQRAEPAVPAEAPAAAVPAAVPATALPAALEPGAHEVEVDGVTLAYEVAGTGPACLVHSGGPGADADYLRIPALEEHLTMVYLDPPGTGRSSRIPGGDYSVERYADLAKGLIAHLRADKPLFLGHSHGGFVGLELAARHPGLLSGLIAYSTAPVDNAELKEEADLQLAACVRRQPDRAEIAAAGQAWFNHGPIRADDTYTALLNAALPAYFADYRRTVAEIGPIRVRAHADPILKPVDWDVRGRLADITVPTLVVCGAYDFVCPPRWADEMCAKIPGARQLLLTASGHFGHLEAERELFLDGVVKFVARAVSAH